MPSVLITGASGFIGGQLFRRFQDEGWQVSGLGRRHLNMRGYVCLDLAKASSAELGALVGKHDVVVHAAARSSPWGSRSQFEQANVWATQRLVDACELNGCPRLIFISSSSVYYKPQDQLGITEATPQASPAVNQYASSKQRAERIVKAYSGSWAIMRPRAVYGRGDSVLFPRILKAAKAGRLPVLIRAGEPVVGDLIAAENLVEFLYQAGSRESIVGEYNLTDNHPVEILGFLLGIFQRLGIRPPTQRISVNTAFRVARVIELLYAALLIRKEPPITQFGVHVFAYSKTFDVTNMISTFGPPKRTTAQAVDDFISWIETDDPYRSK